MRLPIFLAAASFLGAQQPPISNAKLQASAASGGLEPAIRAAMAKQSGPAWIGYAVPKIPGDGDSCCWNNGRGGCGLEGNRSSGARVAPGGPVQLEGPSHIVVLLRTEGGAVGKIKTFTADCPLDAGGLPMHWIAGAKPAESVAMLEKYVSEKRDSSVHAIAMHAGREASAALDKLASSNSSEAVRKSAIFWLAVSRGREGYQTVARLVREDASPKVREHAIFALTQSSEPDAIPAVIAVAKQDRDLHVRGQALFWLAQKAARQQAASAIGDAIARDPDAEVKKKAVFALTQMPNGDGVPMLIQTAKANSNREVRKQAMFWLGQSKDARAVKFFEEVLAR